MADSRKSDEPDEPLLEMKAVPWLVWVVGASTCAALILMVTHLTEEEEFLSLLERIEPLWLGLALLLQTGTYVSQGIVWRILDPLALGKGGHWGSRCFSWTRPCLRRGRAACALGVSASPGGVFAGFMVSTLFRTIGIMPGGLGTFETASVMSLKSIGLPLPVGLSATLLFRGLSFWLPMFPGFARSFMETSAFQKRFRFSDKSGLLERIYCCCDTTQAVRLGRPGLLGFSRGMISRAAFSFSFGGWRSAG